MSNPANETHPDIALSAASGCDDSSAWPARERTSLQCRHAADTKPASLPIYIRSQITNGVVRPHLPF
nr:hypothetical protein CFP56_11574 [Quercus suber]